MRVFNSLKAWEEVSIYENDQFIDDLKVEHATYQLSGLASEQEAKVALAECMTILFSNLLSTDKKLIFFNRSGPDVIKGDDGLWGYRWRAGFLAHNGTHFTLSKEDKY